MPTVVHFESQSLFPYSVDLAALIDALPDRLAFFNARNPLSVCNRSFREISRSAVEGKIHLNSEVFIQQSKENRFFAAASPPRGRLAQQCMTMTGAVPQAPWPLALDGSCLAAEPRPTSDGGKLSLHQDVTRFRTTEEQLRQDIEDLKGALRAAMAARQDALEIARTRGVFLAATSHELRTPLNAILGFSEMINQEIFGPVGNEHYRDYAQIIYDSGSHLLKLINDLLDMSKLDNGKMELHLEPVEIFKVIVDCLRGVETQANKSHVGISINLSKGIGCLQGDDKRLHQMLLNLLSNAIKFTPEGGEINVCAFRSGDYVAISVSDNGIGIKPDDIPRILEPFGQVDSAQSRKHDGTGLGLPLTKELAELHGGSLSIESTQDVGTTVTILLPSDGATSPA